MSWELVFLLSVIIGASTTIYLVKPPTVKERSEDILALWNVNQELVERIARVESEHKSVHALAEETKKILSTKNLQLGITARRGG